MWTDLFSIDMLLLTIKLKIKKLIFISYEMNLAIPFDPYAFAIGSSINIYFHPTLSSCDASDFQTTILTLHLIYLVTNSSCFPNAYEVIGCARKYSRDFLIDAVSL